MITITGHVHNARAATFNDTDCWLGSIQQNGRFTCKSIDISSECDTKEQAIEWVKRRLLALSVDSTTISVRDGGNSREYTYSEIRVSLPTVQNLCDPAWHP